MAYLTYVAGIPLLGQRLYEVVVNGVVGVGEVYTVNSTLGVLAQYTAVTGDDNAAVATALKATINPTYTAGVTTTNPNAFGFRIPTPNLVTSTPTSTPAILTTSITPVTFTTVPYAKRFQVTFDPPSGGSFGTRPRYRLDILQKNYSGGVTNLTGGPSGFIQSWQKDEAKPAIKGCSLTAGILNEGSLPLSTFYSVDDDEFKFQFYWLDVGSSFRQIDRLLFEGFLSPDDSAEQMIDYTHELTLVATDGLGLLKDVTLDKAPASYEILFSNLENYEVTISGGSVLLVGIPFGDNLLVGDKLSIDSGPQYTIKSLVKGGSVYNVGLVENPAAVSPTTGTIAIFRSSLLEKITKSSLLKRCLSATGLELNTNVYCNLFEYNQVDTSSYLDQTLIDPQTFFSNDKYDDCYTVLEKIFRQKDKTAMVTLFQSDGLWNIVRWDELRYYSNNIPGYSYDKDFTLLGTVTLPDALIIDRYDPLNIPETFPETGLINKIFSGDILVKERFDYKQPELLRNSNLQQLGSPIHEYTVGTGTALNKVKEYKVPWWWDAVVPEGDNAVVSDFFIRVIYDFLDNEIDRSLVVIKDYIRSYRIEASKDDSFKFSYTVDTASVPIYIKLTDGIQTVWYRGTQGAIPASYGWNNAQHTYTLDEANGFSVDTKDFPIPFDGELFFFLKGGVTGIGIPSPGFSYRDIRLEFNAFINQSTKIIGHTHTSEQVASIKQKEEDDISVDDSPRNFISGTLFLDQLNGVIQKRTSQWKRNHIPLEKRKLGNITTMEQLFWRSKARTILEGSFVGLLRSNQHVSMLTVFRCSIKPEISELNFVFGKLEIDYKNDRISNSTLWEMYKDGEPDIVSKYDFKYLYNTK